MAGKPFTIPAIRWLGRRVMPGGYLLGRLSAGQGDVEMIPVSSLSAAQVASGVVQASPQYGGKVGVPYLDAGLFLMGNTGGVQQLFPLSYYPFAPAPVALKFPSTNATALAKCQVAPTTSSAIIHITTDVSDFQTNGPTGSKTICTFTFANGAFTATVVQRNTATIARGAFLYAIFDGNWVDTAIAYINIALPGDT